MFIDWLSKYVGIRYVICVYLFQSNILSCFLVDIILKHIIIYLYDYIICVYSAQIYDTCVSYRCIL